MDLTLTVKWNETGIDSKLMFIPEIRLSFLSCIIEVIAFRSLWRIIAFRHYSISSLYNYIVYRRE